MPTSMIRSRGVITVLIVLALAASSCGKSSRSTAPVALTPTQASDAAVQVAALVMSGGSASPVPAALMAQGGAALSQVRKATPTAAAAETTITGENFSWTFSIRWFDALGNEMESYDPVHTTRMVADSRGAGSYTGPHGTMTVGTSGHLQVSGLSVAQQQLHTDATQADTLTYNAAGENGSVSFRALATGGLQDIVEDKPVDSGHPLSGTASWTLSVNKSIEGPNGNLNEHFDATAVVTFNGTHLVPLVINGTWHYTLDLDTGEVTPVAV